MNVGQDYLFAEHWQLVNVWEVCFEVCLVVEQKWHASALTKVVYDESSVCNRMCSF